MRGSSYIVSYFLPELMMRAMTFIYEGRRDLGLDRLHRSLGN
jgi:hypothetical protein